MANVGFIGLGTMGAPMASHLLDGGHRLTENIDEINFYLGRFIEKIGS